MIAGEQGGRVLSSLEDLRLGDHVCWPYGDRAELVAGLISFVRNGLRAGQRVACYLEEAHLEDILADLRADLPESGAALVSGALVVSSFESAYTVGTSFDLTERLESYAALTRRALADGYTALRAIGQASLILGHPTTREVWPGYELRADLLATTLPFIGVCAYEIGSCDPEAVRLMRAVHSSSHGMPGPEPGFQLHATRRGALAVAGEIDFLSSDAISRIATAGPLRVSEAVIDVSRLRFLDAAGMRALIKHAQAIAESNELIKISGASHTFRRLWTLLDCDSRIEAEMELV